MRFLYFSIFLLILLGIAGGYFYFNQQYFSFLSSAQSASLQANILALKDYAVKSPAIEEKKPLTMVFVGDIMLDRGVEAVVNNYDNYRYPFLKTVDILKSADLAFGNLEGPISNSGNKQGSIYSFRFEPKAINGLKFAGFDVLSLANNHIMDYGREALKDTISILNEGNINLIGAGENYLEANNPLIREINNVKIAFLGYALMN